MMGEDDRPAGENVVPLSFGQAKSETASQLAEIDKENQDPERLQRDLFKMLKKAAADRSSDTADVTLVITAQFCLNSLLGAIVALARQANRPPAVQKHDNQVLAGVMRGGKKLAALYQAFLQNPSSKLGADVIEPLLQAVPAQFTEDDFSYWRVRYYRQGGPEGLASLIPPDLDWQKLTSFDRFYLSVLSLIVPLSLLLSKGREH